MNQKQNIIKIYQEKDIIDIFDKERNKYLFQKDKHKIESNFLKKAINSLKKNKIKVLDVACGTGRMLQETFSIKKDIEYYGIDTSKEIIKHLKEKAKKLGVEKNIKIKIGDAEKMPFKDESFDIVYSFHLLWHLEKEGQEKIIKEMLRVCKKEGLVVFDILNKHFIWERIKHLFGKRKTEGIYKLSLNEIKRIVDKKNLKIDKLSDFPVKNPKLYFILNSVNIFKKILPNSFFHMNYIKIIK